MTRHQAERLDVHHETVGRALRPALDHLLARQPVIGRVDFDRVEVLGVVRQALSGLYASRIPVLGQGVVGPGTRADPDLSHRASIRDGAQKAPSPTCQAGSAYKRILILALTEVNVEAVALTQPPGMPGVGEAHPVDVMSRSATVVRAWKVDVVFLPVFFRTML